MRRGRLVATLGVLGILAGSVALGLFALGLGATDEATASASPAVVTVEGGVSASGAAEGLVVGWSSRQVAPGRYEVLLPAQPVTFEVTAWDAVADALATPLGGGRIEVLFQRERWPVDSRFTFRATLPR